jgi:2-aminoethylphosphonate transport system ATP-binding protein
MAKAMVRIAGLRKRFGAHEVLCGIDLEVEKGATVAIIGPSGSGKSTLLRCVNYLEEPTSGTIEIDGQPLAANPKASFREREARLNSMRSQVGMVFQRFNLFPHRTALGNVMEGLLVVRKLGEAQSRVQASEMLDRVGLSDKLDSYPVQLSGGQQQRVAIARALAIRPQVLLLDEPLSALDAQIRRSMLDELAKLHRDLPNLTVLYVTHDQTEALTLANHIGIMRDGKLKAFGGAQSLFRHPPNRFAAEFLGRANLLSVAGLEPVEGNHARVKFGSTVLSAQNHHRLPKGSDCLLCVRPHDFKLRKSEHDINMLTGVVQSVQWQGDVHNITLEVAEHVLRLTSTPMSSPPEPGATLTVHFDPADVTLVPEDSIHG